MTPAVVTRVTTPTRAERIPIVLVATTAEAHGARMRIGGLRVIDRAIRQLSRLRDATVLIATDGSIPLPRRLPPNMDIREIDGDPAAAVGQLRTELGDEAMVLG
ncbi:MAG: hypothetical protein ABUR63_07540, partial [Verrucomicrobiota bacterium]